MVSEFGTAMDDCYDAIVTHYGSPLLVLAGPGAGKTYLLADRVSRILADDSDAREATTVLTFGRDASHDMRRRLLDQEGDFRLQPDLLPSIRTLHSLGFEIVKAKPRQVGLRKTDLGLQEDERIRKLLYRDSALIVNLSEDESKAANLCKGRGDCTHSESFCHICDKYCEIMSKLNKIDFDDQVLLACRILEENSDILEAYQANCCNLLVDEYQDINAAQFRLIELLSRKGREGLFVVGDDAQSIYAFRGADPGFILRFASDYPAAVTPPLRHSRRCHENILEPATRVLAEYYPQWAGPYDLHYHSASGEAPFVWQLPSEVGEAEMVARLARRFVDERKTVLVLAPKADFFRLISKALRKWNVAHECPSTLLARNTLTRLTAASIISQWAQCPTDSFLTRLAVEELIDYGIDTKVPGASKGPPCTPETIRRRIAEETRIAMLWESVDRETSLYSAIQEAPAKGVLAPLKETLAVLLDRYIDCSGEKTGDFARLLARATGGWVQPSRYGRDICAMLALLGPTSATGIGFARLMTMRKAKGLEADVVIVVGLEDDIIPNPKQDLSEEARLFYVSMTRAREQLYLFHAFRRPRDISFGQNIMDKTRSRFLDALGIPSDYKTL